ncbi:MAG: aspartate/tyrosine/aromatic aminotransferase [Candidatus Accumulibacter sp.]|jgi:aromatic-amino-acid transaminase|nr:aspartate/tyrosine/aromatic aminotransferase [Accumulibacter sp.]
MTSSIFSSVEMAPRDPILGLNEAFNADPRPGKVNLGVGVYFDDDGKIPLLGAVKIAEKARMESALARGYLPIDGSPAYNKVVQDMLFGKDSVVLGNGRVVTVQALGGTGALKVGADYLKRLFPGTTVYISDPSWENHRALFESAGFPVDTYSYYDPETRGVNFPALKARLDSLAPGSIVVFHACCHNPTGADMTEAEWRGAIESIRARSLVAFVDMAYQGFADGIVEDASALGQFVDSGVQFFVASSFSKSFSFYGERVGALSIVTASKDESARVLSQVKRVIRTNYSNPPTHGGAIVTAILSNPEWRALWESELAGMRDRIRAMRTGLLEKLKARGVKGDLSYFVQQRGMFTYTGLSPEQVARLKDEFAIYAVSTGRICMAALNTRNLDYVADSIVKVL